MATLINDANYEASNVVYISFGEPTVKASISDFLKYLTQDPNLTNSLATVALAFFAFAALVASFASVFVGVRALKIQHRHNVLSVRPLASIVFGDYENRLSIQIYNNGSGPMIIKALHVSQDSSFKDKHKDNVIDWMPTLPDWLLWDDFRRELSGQSLAPGGEVTLLYLTDKFNDGRFCEPRDACRTELAKLTIKVEYTDIYDTKITPVVRSLSWFSRNK